MAVEESFVLGDLEFVWSQEKGRANVRKHGITFEEAATTWFDPDAVERYDEEHSDREDRWIRIGMSLRGALLVTWSSARTRKGRESIRVIGSRRASPGERRVYEK
jgi:uncharacterized protein